MKNSLFAITILLFTSLSIYGQDTIVAGDTTGMFYFDFEPDLVIYHGDDPPLVGYRFKEDSIDIDFNGIKDLVFQSDRFDSLGRFHFELSLFNPIPNLEFCVPCITNTGWFLGEDQLNVLQGEKVVCPTGSLTKWNTCGTITLLYYDWNVGPSDYKETRNFEYMPIRIPTQDGYATGWINISIHSRGIFGAQIIIHDYAIQRKGFLTPLKEQNKIEYQVFPNPTSEKITFCENSNQISKIEIIDGLGNNHGIVEIPIDDCFEIDISNIPKGIFFLRVANSNGFIKTEKLIKF